MQSLRYIGKIHAKCEAMGREQLATFLKEHGLAPDPIDLPVEYEEAMAKYGISVVDVTPE